MRHRIPSFFHEVKQQTTLLLNKIKDDFSNYYQEAQKEVK